MVLCSKRLSDFDPLISLYSFRVYGYLLEMEIYVLQGLTLNR